LIARLHPELLPKHREKGDLKEKKCRIRFSQRSAGNPLEAKMAARSNKLAKAE